MMKKWLLAFCVSACGELLGQSIPNAAPMPYTQFQFFDNLGVPLAGGKVCTYAAGTSTPLATYTDSTAGTPNSNPVTLDSAGRAPIFLGSSLYKIVIRQGGTGGSCSDGTVITSSDNVSDVALYFVNYVKTISTSTLISYLNPVTGGVTRTQYAKNNDILSAKDLGAVGDGSTDDTAAIVKIIAITSLQKCVYFPDGIYLTSAAITTTHQVCLTGNNWRIKYTGGATIPALFSIIGNPVPGDHSTFMEGSFLQGMILDGQGKATNGLLLQAVVSTQENYLKITNVIDAGVQCSWCQQANFDHLMVSDNFEHFTTVPARGVVIDNISSANYFSNINIEHTSSHGIDIVYGFNNVFIGGTSEGNGGWGFHCVGTDSPFKQCTNNAIIQMDMEVNTLGDVLYSGNQSFANTIIDANAFSTPAIQFANSAHGNTMMGGGIGCGSNAAGSTFMNRIINVLVICVTPPIWTDSGSNHADTLYNQFAGTFADETNNFGRTYTQRYFATARSLQINTASPGNDANFITGAGCTTGPVAPLCQNFLGMDSNDGFTASWLFYNAGAGGLNFMSETSPGVGAVADGSIVNHNWGFGRFNQSPAYRFHFFDAVTNEVAIQAGSGQAGAPLATFRNYAGTSQTNIGADGKFNGPVQAAGTRFTISGCGAAPVDGGSTGGSFTVTTTGACNATVTMGGGVVATHSWACYANNGTTANLLRSAPINTTQAAIVGTTVSGDLLSFGCIAY